MLALAVLGALAASWWLLWPYLAGEPITVTPPPEPEPPHHMLRSIYDDLR